MITHGNSTGDRKKRLIRCAIYTRKSTEEGLEQDYNTLDAQRDSGESYIASLKGEGWVCLPTRYDDGGYTGGNMERPALGRLLADIERGQIDCIVVYKVDRLSRSLMDFAKIMAVLERRNVSFVSVTQQFNTNTSMGRLMLNVLLSFAQFEREIISERTRDKIAAARRKGKWIGGRPVLGYDVVPGGGRVVINEAEASQVRQIFEMYLQMQSMLPVVRELNHRGWLTKQWTTRKDKVRGGERYTKEHVWRILTNIAYIGKVRYKDEIHQGEHQPTIDEGLWNCVQKNLRTNALGGGPQVRNKYGALLRGLLYCKPCDTAMTHTYTTRGKRTYRYYVCLTAQKRGWDACPTKSIPAGEIEKFVVDRLRAIGRDSDIVARTLREVHQQSQAQLEDLQEERRQVERELNRCGEEIHKLIAQAGSGLADETPASARLADLQERIRILERRATEIREQIITAGDQEHKEQEFAAALAAFDPVWDELAPKEKARVLQMLLERVTYDGQEGTLAITFRPNGLKALAQEAQEAAQ